MALGLLVAMADGAAGHEAVMAAERSSGWGKYRNRDLRMAFDFPSSIFTLESAEQSENGVVFSTPDGRARIRVFGFRNEANETPREYLNKIARPGEAKTFTYVRTTPRFFVASGTRDGNIFYRRCNFFENRMSCFQLDYPEREKRAWDDVVTRISLSLAAAD